MSEDRQCLFMVGMDIASEKEDLFNEIYDDEHIPYILEVPGVLGVTRYEVASANYTPKYLAVFELESPAVLETQEYKSAIDQGRWAEEIRPYTYNRTQVVYFRRS